MSATETTTYRVETVYALDDKASAQLGTIGGAAGKAGKSLDGLVAKMGAVVLAGGGMKLGADALVGFNSRLEQSRITITGLLQLNHPGEQWADNFGRAERLVDRFTLRMKAAVGTTEDAVNMASMLVNPLSAAGGSMKQLENMSVGATVAAKALNIQSDVAARDVAEALTGRLTATSTFAKALLQPMGFTTQKFNALSAEKRLSTMDQALNSPALRQMAAAQENTWAGVTSTLEDNLKIALGKVGLPLFKALTEEVKGWNRWLEQNQDKVAEIGRDLSDGLVSGFKAVKSAVQFLIEHKDSLISIGKVWAASKVIGGVGDFVNRGIGGASGFREQLSMPLGKGSRDSAGKFVKGVGFADAAGPVAAAAAAGWELGRVIDEQTGAGRALVNAWDAMTGSAMESVMEAEDRNRVLREANNELQKQIRAAAARFAGKGGATETNMSAQMAGAAADLRNQAEAARDRDQTYNRVGAAVMAPLFGTINAMGDAKRLDTQAQLIEDKRTTATALTDTYVNEAWKEMTAGQRALVDRAAGTNAVLTEIANKMSTGDMFGAFLGKDRALEILLGAKDPDALAKSKKPPNVSIGTLKVEVAAKDPDRWIQRAITTGLEKVRRAPTSIGASRAMRGGM